MFAIARPTESGSPVWLRWLTVIGTVLAVGATILLVVSDDVRWVRLAGIAAVWAAFLGAFAVTRSRREARIAELRQEESKRTYELELLREVTARREYEVGFAEVARAEADAAHRAELVGLREQVDQLNTSLSSLFDGSLLFERLTVSAHTTRVRSIGEVVEQPVALQSAAVVDAQQVLVPDEWVEPDADADPAAEPDRAADRTAHSSGIPVAELLAAFGGSHAPAGQRHRTAE